MKIAVMGAGGIGSYLGALLACAGHTVWLVCRGEHLKAIQANGLTLQRRGASRAVPIQATDNPGDVGAVDVVIVAVKLYDLESAAQAMRPMVDSHTIVVPIQNGVTSHEVLQKVFDAHNVLGGTVFISAAIPEPGIVVGRGKTDRLVFGELDGQRSERALAFQQACNAADIDTVLSTDVLSAMWHKFTGVTSVGAISTLARQGVGYICADERLNHLMMLGMQEVMAVAKRNGIHLPDDTVAKCLAFAHSVTYGAKVSLLEDLERGKPLELDWLSGHVAKLGESLGVPTPVHSMAYACLAPFNRTR